MRDYRADLTDIFSAAVDGAGPERLVREKVFNEEGRIMIDNDFEFKPEKIYMFAFGKAACSMARGLMSVCDVDRGVIATGRVEKFPENIKVIKAGHPLPDEGSVKAAEAMLALAKEADEKTLCVFLVSGGGSAMLCMPAFGITLKDKMRTFDMLIRCGADIDDINTVRRHISGIKGGRLGEAARPARCVTLAISDVISGSPVTIASGPTYLDNSTWGDALEVVTRYRLTDKLPESVTNALKMGLEGVLPDTVKGTMNSYRYYILASNLGGMQSAGEKAQELGYRPRVLGQFDCDVSGAAEVMAAAVSESIMMGASSDNPVCMIFGGEVTVSVIGTGKGGRCQQLAIEYLMMQKAVETCSLCASTDGMDGPTDAAGAFTDDSMDADDAETYAISNDAYHYFEKYNALLKTGLTGTNVNDLYIVIVPASRLTDELQALASESSYI